MAMMKSKIKILILFILLLVVGGNYISFVFQSGRLYRQSYQKSGFLYVRYREDERNRPAYT